jgi:RNA methyltransferase, TrmH family
MISIAEKKLIRSLSKKKFRNKHGFFLIEGTKIVLEAFHSNVEIHYLFATQEWLSKFRSVSGKAEHIRETTTNEIAKVSNLQSSPDVLVVARLPEPFVMPENPQLILCLEDIQDPGNLGAIIRVADWYAADFVYCTPGCADCYQPKVVQASKGSLFHIPVKYDPVEKWTGIESLTKLAADTQGQNINTFRNSGPVALFLGNEGHGLSNEMMRLCDVQISVKRYGKAESLNVASAAAVLLDRLKSNIV